MREFVLCINIRWFFERTNYVILYFHHTVGQEDDRKLAKISIANCSSDLFCFQNTLKVNFGIEKERGDERTAIIFRVL